MMQQNHLTVRRWRRLCWLAPVLAVAFTLLLALPAYAETITNTREPFSGSFTNPCNGAVVTLSGEFHDVFHVTLDGNGGFHSFFHESVHATGVDDQGNQYEINRAENESQHGLVGGEETVTQIVPIITKGSAPNFIMKDNLHVTVNPDGTVTSFHDNFSTQCQG